MKMMKKLFALLLVLCMVFSLCACAGNSDTNEDEQNNNKVNSEVNDDESGDASSDESEEDDEQTPASFKVKVVDQNGNPVVGCIVQICKDTCMPKQTNAEGIATFNVEIEEGHYLSISKCPEGYEYTGEEKIYLEAGDTEYTLEMTAAQ